MTRTLLQSVLATALMTSAALAQTAGIWGGDIGKVTLNAADGSAVLSFQCDPIAKALVVTSSYGVGTLPQRITVRVNNGTAYSVPLQPSNSSNELIGGLSTSLINQAHFAQASTLMITAPPTDRPAIIVDVVPELTNLINGCPRD